MRIDIDYYINKIKNEEYLSTQELLHLCEEYQRIENLLHTTIEDNKKCKNFKNKPKFGIGDFVECASTGEFGYISKIEEKYDDLNHYYVLYYLEGIEESIQENDLFIGDQK